MYDLCPASCWLHVKKSASNVLPCRSLCNTLVARLLSLNFLWGRFAAPWPRPALNSATAVSHVRMLFIIVCRTGQQCSQKERKRQDEFHESHCKCSHQSSLSCVCTHGPLSPLRLPHIASSIPPSYAQWRKVRRHKCSLSYSYIMILPCYTMAKTHSRPPGAMQLWDHSTWYEDGCVVFHVALQYKRLCKMACMC